MGNLSWNDLEGINYNRDVVSNGKKVWETWICLLQPHWIRKHCHCSFWGIICRLERYCSCGHNRSLIDNHSLGFKQQWQKHLCDSQLRPHIDIEYPFSLGERHIGYWHTCRSACIIHQDIKAARGQLAKTCCNWGVRLYIKWKGFDAKRRELWHFWKISSSGVNVQTSFVERDCQGGTHTTFWAAGYEDCSFGAGHRFGAVNVVNLKSRIDMRCWLWNEQMELKL